MEQGAILYWPFMSERKIQTILANTIRYKNFGFTIKKLFFYSLLFTELFFLKNNNVELASLSIHTFSKIEKK